MRDIINRLNEAAKFGPPGQPAPLSASEQMATEIGAELEQFVYSAHDRIETILKTEGAALSARMPGYYIVLSGGHGMTQVEVYPPPSVVQAMQADEDQDGPFWTEHRELVDVLNDQTSPNYFYGYRLADNLARQCDSLSFTEFGSFAFYNGEEIPWQQADAYENSLSRSIQSVCRP